MKHEKAGGSRLMKTCWDPSDPDHGFGKVNNITR
jgi:hypothetical protein